MPLAPGGGSLMSGVAAPPTRKFWGSDSPAPARFTSTRLMLLYFTSAHVSPAAPASRAITAVMATARKTFWRRLRGALPPRGVRPGGGVGPFGPPPPCRDVGGADVAGRAGSGAGTFHCW